jgi:hypothetical protein
MNVRFLAYHASLVDEYPLGAHVPPPAPRPA